MSAATNCVHLRLLLLTNAVITGDRCVLQRCAQAGPWSTVSEVVRHLVMFCDTPQSAAIGVNGMCSSDATLKMHAPFFFLCIQRILAAGLSASNIMPALASFTTVLPPATLTYMTIAQSAQLC
jgi:hypothetical protein